MNDEKAKSTDGKVTGKLILSECATLAGHLGSYLYGIAKDVYTRAKEFLSRRSKAS